MRKLSTWRSWGAIAVILIMLALAAEPAFGSGRRARKSKSGKKTTIESVSAEKKRTEQEIRNASARLETKKAEISRQLGQLDRINSEIESNNRSIAHLAAVSDSLGILVKNAEDSVALLDEEVQELKRGYIKVMRRLQPYANTTSMLSFIFSAESFKTAARRVRYVREFSRWRSEKARRLEEASVRLAEKKERVAALHSRSAGMLQNANNVKAQLNRNRDNANKIVSDLRKDESTLRKVLEEKKRQSKALDQRLDRMIAEEQARIAREEEAARRAAEKKEAERRKAEAAKARETRRQQQQPSTKPEKEKPAAKPEKKAPAKERPALAEATTDIGRLTGSFAENKGRLPFPVAGKYRIVSHFGRQPHPSLPKVMIENSGIDIETSSGAQARAVFEGKVSAIFREEGFNSIVMIRHGKYITIYAGLDRISVKTGDRVKAGQALGTVNRDAARGVPVLHFEIRNERTKLNPAAWLK